MTSKRRKGQFDFKQFSIVQKESAMKVGTDGVLLGAWTNIGMAKSALDIGAGTGLIAIMLAQRQHDLHIDAVEIDSAAVKEASSNIASCPWADRINIIQASIQEFSVTSKYDVIVSNPPYFSAGFSSLASTRQRARHNIGLPQEQLLSVANDVMSSNGRLSLILPTREGEDFIRLADASGLFLQRKTAFYATKKKPQERWLLEFSRTPVSNIRTTELIHYNDDGTWTDAYKDLTRDFYLNL